MGGKGEAETLIIATFLSGAQECMVEPFSEEEGGQESESQEETEFGIGPVELAVSGSTSRE